MIYKHAHPLPYGAVAWAKTMSKLYASYGWGQHRIQDAKLRQRFIDMCGYRGKRLRPSVICHLVQDDVPSHADNVAKSTYLIPIITTKTVKFFVREQWGGYRTTELIPGVVYRFSDYHDHGISNEYRSCNVIVSVSFDHER